MKNNVKYNFKNKSQLKKKKKGIKKKVKHNLRNKKKKVKHNFKS